MSLRIVTGSMSGRKIAVPDNNRVTRPTMDKTREAVFNSLRHRSPSMQGAIVLDVFAGSGAYGIEAISNGAAYATFFEQDRMAVQTLERNLRFLEINAVTSVQYGSAIQPSQNRAKVATHAFFDPPYGSGFLDDAINSLLDKGWIDCETLLIIEREHSKTKTEDLPEALEILADKKYGRALITYAKIAKG